MDKSLQLSIVMPCLNEANTLETCIGKARGFLVENGIEGEIVIADNGSTDGSITIAKRLADRLVLVEDRGHGHALYAGIVASEGKYIIMGDSDDSYDFSDLGGFLEKFEAGYEMVIGNRFLGGIENGAMPVIHRYFGNPMLSFLNRVLFANAIYDVHGGLRGFDKSAFMRLNIESRDMSFCTEMIARATLKNLKLTDIPIRLYKDGRGRKPHLKTWRDGWACVFCSITIWRHRKAIQEESYGGIVRFSDEGVLE